MNDTLSTREIYSTHTHPTHPPPSSILLLLLLFLPPPLLSRSFSSPSCLFSPSPFLFTEYREFSPLLSSVYRRLNRVSALPLLLSLSLTLTQSRNTFPCCTTATTKGRDKNVTAVLATRQVGETRIVKFHGVIFPRSTLPSLSVQHRAQPPLFDKDRKLYGSLRFIALVAIH